VNELIVRSHLDHLDDANGGNTLLHYETPATLYLYAGGVMSVSEHSGGALIRAKRCACGIPPALWRHEHGNALLRFVKKNSLGDTLEASYK
jgi:hypothetical protein